MDESKASQSSAVTAKLRRAVDWKIFELSAVLISEEALEADLKESQKWFQARHAEEIVEERQCTGICGYPLCSNSLKKMSAQAKYRIDYGNKKIYEIEKSALYCSGTCLEKSELWIRSLDITLPYSRPVAKLLLQEEKSRQTPAGIDEVLSVLNNPPSSAPAAAEPPNPLPPHPFLNEEGAVKVEFENGRPVPVPPPSPLEAPPSPSRASRGQGDMADIISTMKQLQVKYNLAPHSNTADSSTLLPIPSPAPAPVSVYFLAEGSQSPPPVPDEERGRKKRSVNWSTPSAGAPMPSMKTLSTRGVGLQVKERPIGGKPLSAQALATKREPSLAYIHRMNYVGDPEGGELNVKGIAFSPPAHQKKKDYGEIEGYTPNI